MVARHGWQSEERREVISPATTLVSLTSATGQSFEKVCLQCCSQRVSTWCGNESQSLG
jgi:hypothetical protein